MATSVTTAKAPLTVVIAAKNEERNIPSCIASVADWASQVLVVEHDSSDHTVMLSRAEGADVFAHPFETIGKQRNAAIMRAAHEWILVLDADERCTPELAAEIRQLLMTGAQHEAYRIRRRNFFLGKEIRHAGWERDKPVRLFRRALRYDERPVHEHVITNGPVGTLKHPMLHYSYRSLDQYFAKLDRYSNWWAEQQYQRGRRAGGATVVLRPLARFFTMYFLRGGWRDGAYGALVSVLGAMSVAAKYARLWEMSQRGDLR